MTKRTSQTNEEVKVVTSGGNIRVEPAKSSRQTKTSKPKVIVTVAQDFVPVNGFVAFLREHAVVGLVIGFVIGGQVQLLVKQIVQSFLDPLTQLLFGTALSQRTFTLHFGDRSANFGWGALIYNLIIFLLVLITMYIAIKGLKLDKLEKPAKED